MDGRVEPWHGCGAVSGLKHQFLVPGVGVGGEWEQCEAARMRWLGGGLGERESEQSCETELIKFI